MTIYVPQTREQPVCAICAAPCNLESVLVKKVFTPSWVWFLLPFGILPAALVAMAVQTKHNLVFQFCPACKSRRAWMGAIHWLAMLSCIVLFFVAVVVGLDTRSWLAFAAVFAIVIGIAVISSRYHARANPKYVVFSKERVEIDVPGRGRVVVFPA